VVVGQQVAVESAEPRVKNLLGLGPRLRGLAGEPGSQVQERGGVDELAELQGESLGKLGSGSECFGFCFGLAKSSVFPEEFGVLRVL
jgi:hypothetical protein